MKNTTFTRRGAMALGAGALGAAMLPRGASAQVDFSGRTIEWIIPFATGGGSDTWARFNAPFLTRHLPGNPNVVVVNEPGGGSTRGTNLFAQRARPDGLTMLGTSGSTQFPYLLGDPRVRYEYQDWSVVMVGPTGGVAYVSPSTGVNSLDDVASLQGQRLVYASQGATSLDLVPMLAFKLLGFPQNVLWSVQGSKRSIRGKVSRAYRWPLQRRSDRVGPLALARMVPDSVAHPAIDELRRGEAWMRAFRGPMALVWGTRDPILGKALRRHEEAFPNAPVTLTQAGHFLQEEVPEALASAIEGVLQRSESEVAEARASGSK